MLTCSVWVDWLAPCFGVKNCECFVSWLVSSYTLYLYVFSIGECLSLFLCSRKQHHCTWLRALWSIVSSRPAEGGSFCHQKQWSSSILKQTMHITSDYNTENENLLLLEIKLGISAVLWKSKWKQWENYLLLNKNKNNLVLILLIIFSYLFGKTSVSHGSRITLNDSSSCPDIFISDFLLFTRWHAV